MDIEAGREGVGGAGDGEGAVLDPSHDPSSHPAADKVLDGLAGTGLGATGVDLTVACTLEAAGAVSNAPGNDYG